MDWLVGDVQGCDAALGQLLDAIGFSPSRDRLHLLGDLVNRGPQSLATLQRLQALGDAAVCLLGNHDLHLLAAACSVRPPNRRDTLTDILEHPQRAGFVEWMRQRPLAAQAHGWLLVHAGLSPSWDRAKTLGLAAQLQAVLRGPDWRDFIADMYGDQPARWDEGLRGQARWRCITNVLTRMRFCAADGTQDFDSKEGAQAAPAGFMPWFEVPGRASAGQPVAFGHWSTLGLVNRPDLLALDTGCVWGGQLSAMRVDGGRRELVQVRCPQAQTPGA